LTSSKVSAEGREVQNSKKTLHGLAGDHKAGVSCGVFSFNLRTCFDIAGEARCFLTKTI
jgi:hypothetical protein